MFMWTYLIDLRKTLSLKEGWAYSRGGPNIEVIWYLQKLEFRRHTPGGAVLFLYLCIVEIQRKFPVRGGAHVTI